MFESGVDWGRIGGVYLVLFGFGLAYNACVGWIERHGYDEGYTAWLVIVGVLVTLAGVAVLDWGAALVTLGAFGASGFWMTVGSWWRHVRRRRRAQELAREV
jgi:hypothetical protein